MPPAPIYTVPVVARRVFGTRYAGGAYLDRRRASDDPDFFLPADLPPMAVRGRVGDVRPVIDRGHGTRRSWEELRAVFTPDASLDHTEGLTVNDLWREAGVEFRIVEEVDDMIASDVADFVPADVRLWKPVFAPLHRLKAINLYFCRELEGRWGQGSIYLPHREQFAVYAIVNDRTESAEWADASEAWRHMIITIAHEFGHVLGLSHVAWIDNVMYGHGTRAGSTGIEPPQWAHARYRARYLAGAADPRSRLRPDVPRRPWPPI
jgi:hypothetical protein